MPKFVARKTMSGDYKIEKDSPFWLKAVSVILYIIGLGVFASNYDSIGIIPALILGAVIAFGGSFLVGLMVGKAKAAKADSIATEAAKKVIDDITASRESLLNALIDAGYELVSHEFEEVNLRSSKGGEVSKTVGPVIVPEGVTKITSLMPNSYDMNHDSMTITTLINGLPAGNYSGIEESLRAKTYDVKPGDMVSIRVVLPAAADARFVGKPAFYFLKK